LVFASSLPLSAHAASTQAANYYPNYAPDTARILDAVDNRKLVTVRSGIAARASASVERPMPIIRGNAKRRLLQRAVTVLHGMDGCIENAW